MENKTNVSAIQHFHDCPDCNKKIKKEVLQDYAKNIKGKELVQCAECGLIVSKEETECPTCGSKSGNPVRT